VVLETGVVLLEAGMDEVEPGFSVLGVVLEPNTEAAVRFEMEEEAGVFCVELIFRVVGVDMGTSELIVVQ
jgi:hypothetical protein